MQPYSKIYKSLLIFSLCVIVAFVIQYIYIRFDLCYSYLPDIRGQEKNVVYGIQQTMDGTSNLYRHIDKPPFAFVQYTPVYYFVCAGICKILGLVPGKDVIQIYSTCRLINLILNIGSCLIAFFFLNRLLGVHWIISSLTVSLFLLSSQSHTWAIRPDALKNVFFLLSLTFFVQWLKREKGNWGIFSALFVGLAIFTKQDMVSLPIGFLIFLWLFESKRSFFLYATYLTSFGLMGIITMIIIYGTSIWENLFWAVNNGASFQNAKSIVIGYFGSYIYLIPLGIYSTIIGLIQKDNKIEKLLSMLTVVLFGFSCLATSKSGSLISYFNETNTLIFISISYLISRESIKNSNLALLTACFSLSLLFQIMGSYKPEMERLKISEKLNSCKLQYEESALIGEYLRPKLRSNDQVYTNGPFLKNVLFDHVLIPMDDIILFNQMAGTFDSIPYSTYFKQQKIKFIVLNKNEPLQDIMGQQFENYIPIKSVGSYIIYQHQ